MRWLATFCLVSLLLGVVPTLGQVVDVKDVDSEAEGTTTIEIKKSKGQTQDSSSTTWDLVDGEVDLSGEPAAMEKEARASWKDACAEWKKEFRADNKDSKIISTNCGTPKCGGEVGKKTCSSKGSYKIKSRAN